MKRLIAVIVSLVLMLSLFGCAANDKLESGNVVPDLFATEIQGDAEMGVGDVSESVADSSAAAQNKLNEKIIKTVSANVETKEYDAYIASLNVSVAENGGYIESSNANFGAYSNSNRYANYVIRIPSEKLDDFLTSAEKNGRITNKSEKQENVTLEYVDLESRIDAYKTERATLTALLEKADTLESVLAVQDRLTDVNYQIETYTAQLKVLENRVSYSTVNLSVNEVERVSAAQPTVWSRIKETFADNLDYLVETVKDIIVGVIGGLPVIIPAAAGIAILILIIRKIIRKRRG